MKRSETTLPGVFVLEPNLYVDERGSLREDFNQELFKKEGLTHQFKQEFHCKSHRGVIRGLHYQKQRKQSKLLQVVFGEIYEVVVDVRRGSPSFGKAFGVSLSAWNMKLLFIPEGFADGFLVMSETADILWKASDYFDPKDQRGVFWNDPHLGVKWPLGEEQYPTLSRRDKEWPILGKVPYSELPNFED